MEATTADGTKVFLHDNGTWSVEKQAGPASSTPQSAGFRKIRWGANKAEIKESERNPPDFESEDSLGFNGNLADLNVLAFYILTDDQLVRAKYIVTQDYQNQNTYIASFLTLKEALTSKYGSPHESNSFWSNDLYEDDPSNWGLAISVGHHSRFENWETNDTSICLALSGENFDIELVIEYTSKTLNKFEIERKQSNLLSEL